MQASQTLPFDLADVTFLDCHTIGMLLRGQRLAAARGVRMHVVNAINPLVRSVLDITGAAIQLESATDAARHGWRLIRAQRSVAA